MTSPRLHRPMVFRAATEHDLLGIVRLYADHRFYQRLGWQASHTGFKLQLDHSK